MGKSCVGCGFLKRGGLWLCGVIGCWVVFCDGFVGLEFWNTRGAEDQDCQGFKILASY